MVIKKGRVHLPSMVRISIYGKDTGGMKGREAYVSLFFLIISIFSEFYFSFFLYIL